MGNFNIIEGDIFTHVDNCEFDVIAHGCNSFNNMNGGIAIPMRIKFGCDKFKMESEEFRGDFNKLGQIDYEIRYIKDGEWVTRDEISLIEHSMFVVNLYSQYHYGFRFGIPIDYDALTLGLRKINFNFKGMRVGIPLISGGLAGGYPEKIKEIMRNELKDCNVTLVLFK